MAKISYEALKDADNIWIDEVYFELSKYSTEEKIVLRNNGFALYIEPRRQTATLIVGLDTELKVNYATLVNNLQHD